MPEDTGHELIFGHASEARAAASVTLVGMLAVLIGGAFMAMGAPVKQGTLHARNAAGGAPAKVRIVGAAPQANAPCEQQVWPNIAQHCLVRSDSASKPARKDAKTGGEAASPAAQDNAKLTPLTATGNAMKRWPAAPAATAATTGSAPATARPQQDARNMPSRADADSDDLDDLPPSRPVEPRPHHRHHGFTFRLHFGGIHF
jgi:cell division septation protein DedD